MLPSFSDFKRIWVEISTDPAHGGAGWGYGECLWVPVTNRSGARRYQVMEQPSRRDAVLHFRREPGAETLLAGWSQVMEPARIVEQSPPEPGEWGGRDQYYRIELGGYSPIEPTVSLATLLDDYADQIRDEIETEHPFFYPFTKHGDGLRTVQGIYLAECTRRLHRTISTALGVTSSALDAESAPQAAHATYAEGQRRSRESQYFARNPRLVKAAKRRADGRCELCGLDARAIHAEIGPAILECHHLDPLSERDGETGSTVLDDVLVVCANCHRMLHSQLDVLSPEELSEVLRVR
jgi:hypothetical protein